jgi:hypothetical protein
MEPKRRDEQAGSANQPDEVAALALFEDIVADDGFGLLESAQQAPNPSADRRSSATSSPARDQADDAAAPGLRLGPQEPLGVGDSLSYALAVEIECCVG